MRHGRQDLAERLALVNGMNSVTASMIDPFPFVVPSGGSRAFTRYFGVGDGSGQNAAELEHQLRGTTTGTLAGCVTVGGLP